MNSRDLVGIVFVVIAGCAEAPEQPPCQWYLDRDGDGFGGATERASCDIGARDNFVTNNADCDDRDASINPEAVEQCDASGRDEDCDGRINSADDELLDPVLGWPDADDDGFGDGSVDAVAACEIGPGFVGNPDDCNDTDERHWSDCAVCIDDDDDGFGTNCDLGADCHDDVASANPRGVESGLDGIDEDCDGLDGIGWFDDFSDELFLDLDTWTAVEGPDVGSPDQILGEDGLTLLGGQRLLSRPRDLSTCTQVYWSVRALRGAVGFGDQLLLEYETDDGWVPVPMLVGTGAADAAVSTRRGIIDDPRAMRFGARIRLRHENLSSGGFQEQFIIEEVLATCAGPDNDGDGRPVEFDCDDSDPLHFADCGVCVDDDSDGFGLGCDLGPDCDDTNSEQSPAADDSSVDGFDANCDGYDREAFFDDFDHGTSDRWQRMDEAEIVADVEGGFVLKLDSFDRAIAPLQDSSNCTSIEWSYRARPVFLHPNPLESHLRVDEISGFLVSDSPYVDEFRVTIEDDGEWVTRSGTIIFSDAGWITPLFQFEFMVWATNGASFEIDDVVIVCSSSEVE